MQITNLKRNKKGKKESAWCFCWHISRYFQWK